MKLIRHTCFHPEHARRRLAIAEAVEDSLTRFENLIDKPSAVTRERTEKLIAFMGKLVETLHEKGVFADLDVDNLLDGAYDRVEA